MLAKETKLEEMIMKNVFKNKLSNFIRSAKNQRESLQWLIEAGIWQYADSGRTSYLSDLLNESVKVKSLPTVTIKDFIKEYTDLKIKTDNKTGLMTFVRANKDAQKKAVIPNFPWYEWKKAKHNDVKEVDHKKLAIKHLSAINDGTHSAKYLANVFIESGFTTSQLENILLSLQINAKTESEDQLLDILNEAA